MSPAKNPFFNVSVVERFPKVFKADEYFNKLLMSLIFTSPFNLEIKDPKLSICFSFTILINAFGSKIPLLILILLVPSTTFPPRPTVL